MAFLFSITLGLEEEEVSAETKGVITSEEHKLGTRHAVTQES